MRCETVVRADLASLLAWKQNTSYYVCLEHKRTLPPNIRLQQRTSTVMKTFSLVAFLMLAASASFSLAQDAIVDAWRYTQKTPADGWQAAAFDDSAWNEGAGGFGTQGTPGARIGTE
ncbi:MAG: hypothetical protein WKF77_19715, partial [Planctomycetaceae bacterium]